MLGIKNENVRDLWEHKDLGSSSGEFTVTLKPHSCKEIKIK